MNEPIVRSSATTVGQLRVLQLAGPWVGANLLGFAVGGASFGAIQRARLEPYFERVPAGAHAARILAVTTGLSMLTFGFCTGTAQWVVLRRWLRVRWWIVATAAGWGLSGVAIGAAIGATAGTMSDTGPRSGVIGFASIAVAACGLLGLLPAALQWTLLRQQVTRASTWPRVSLAGFVAAVSDRPRLREVGPRHPRGLATSRGLPLAQGAASGRSGDGSRVRRCDLVDPGPLAGPPRNGRGVTWTQEPRLIT